MQNSDTPRTQTDKNRIDSRAWNPRGIGWFSFFFSIIPAGILHIINWKRLGHPERRKAVAVNLFFTVCIYIALLFLLEGLLGKMLVFMINSAYSYYFSRSQKKAFKDYMTSGGRKARWYLPILAGVAFQFALIFALWVIVQMTYRDYEDYADADYEWDGDLTDQWLDEKDVEATSLLSQIPTYGFGTIDTIAVVECEEPVVWLEVQDGLIFAWLTNGSVSIVGQSGSLINSVDARLYTEEALKDTLSRMTNRISCTEYRGFTIERESTTRSDWFWMDTRSGTLSIVHNDFREYAYDLEKVWWAFWNRARWLFGTRSVLEVVDYHTHDTLLSHTFFGMAGGPTIDLDLGLAVIHYRTDFSTLLRVVDLQSGETIYDGAAPVGFNDLVFHSDSLYTRSDSMIRAYSVTPEWSIKEERAESLDASIMFEQRALNRNASERPIVVWTDQYEGTVGPWRFVTDSAMYEVYRALDRMDYYPSTYSRYDRELLFNSKDTLYSVSFEDGYSRRYVLDSCSLFCGSPNALSSRTYVVITRSNEFVIFKWTPETE